MKNNKDPKIEYIQLNITNRVSVKELINYILDTGMYSGLVLRKDFKLLTFSIDEKKFFLTKYPYDTSADKEVTIITTSFTKFKTLMLMYLI